MWPPFGFFPSVSHSDRARVFTRRDSPPHGSMFVPVLQHGREYRLAKALVMGVAGSWW
jgi:hypothetical protein